MGDASELVQEGIVGDWRVPSLLAVVFDIESANLIPCDTEGIQNLIVGSPSQRAERVAECERIGDRTIRDDGIIGGKFWHGDGVVVELSMRIA
jgi:hypothetical protein